jgi:hypothetical protein
VEVFVTAVPVAIAVLGVLIAVLELRRGRADATAARTAELSWNIYQAYDSPDLREGRRALNDISRTKPVPNDGAEYGAMYITRSYAGPDADAVNSRAADMSSSSIRRILRFYHQIGVLLDKELIDEDFVFPLIGDGLETSNKGIQVATEWHQNFYGGESGTEWAPTRRIYANAPRLVEHYRRWRAGQDQHHGTQPDAT